MKTEQQYLRSTRTRVWKRCISTLAKLCLVTVGCIQISVAQNPSQLLPKTVPLIHDDQPPGMLGAQQLHRNPQLRGYMQPVELRGPEGVSFSFAQDGFFGEPIPTPARVALLVGVPYRVKITGIPFEPEEELYPTIELIDRTYPPAEKAHRFPIPIEFEAIEFEAAMRGELVTRVVYLEDSANAEPVSYAGAQRIYEATPTENMLQTADSYGRPLGLVRLGSIVPNSTDGFVTQEFMYGSPPVAMLKPIPDPESLYEQGIFRRYETSANAGSEASEQVKPRQTEQLSPNQNGQVLRHAKAARRIGDSY